MTPHASLPMLPLQIQALFSSLWMPALPIGFHLAPSIAYKMKSSHSKPGSESLCLREVQITDAAVLTALGDSTATWQGLLAGATGIRPLSLFPVKNYCSGVAAFIDGLEPFAGESRIRPLIDLLLDRMFPVPHDSFPITATTKGGIDILEKIRRGGHARPGDLPLAALNRLISGKLGLVREGFNISASCASSSIAVAQGASLIALGRAEAVLVCCADLVSEFIFSGFSSLRALSPSPSKPFDRDRQGLCLGEGAAALLLMSGERARRENRASLGKVLGWGISSDAVHITAPDQEGGGLVQAVSRALHMAGLKAGEIGAVSAHGTGTVYNDLMECTAFHKLFGPGGVGGPPVYSVKGALGHSLGAAGGIEVALGMQALASRTVPPTVGLEHPMVEAKGRVSLEAAPIAGECLLTTNSGFGGINAALVLGRGDRA